MVLSGFNTGYLKDLLRLLTTSLLPGHHPLPHLTSWPDCMRYSRASGTLLTACTRQMHLPIVDCGSGVCGCVFGSTNITFSGGLYLAAVYTAVEMQSNVEGCLDGLTPWSLVAIPAQRLDVGRTRIRFGWFLQPRSVQHRVRYINCSSPPHLSKPLSLLHSIHTTSLLLTLLAFFSLKRPII